MKKQYKLAAELAAELSAEKLYTRQEVAAAVGCGWANVMEASKSSPGETPALKGKLQTWKGSQKAWYFSRDEIVAWRASVETRSNSSDKVIIPITEDKDRELLKSLLKDSKFATYC